MKYSFLIISQLILVLNIYAQVQQEWAVRYQNYGTNSLFPKFVQADYAGNIYIAADYDFRTNGMQWIILKYSASGSLMWAKYFGDSTRINTISGLVLADSGKVYVAGTLYNDSTEEDYAIVRMDSSGAADWIRNYNGRNSLPGTSPDICYGLAADPSGNLYITGTSDAPVTPPYTSDIVTLKYNPAGTLLWSKRMQSLNLYDDKGKALKFINGFLYVSGGTGNGAGANQIPLLLKYDPNNGNILWARQFSTGIRDGDFRKIDSDPEGNIVVSGLYDFPQTQYDILTVKYNSAGDSLWVRKFNGSGNKWDAGKHLYVDSAGCIYVMGGCENNVIQGYFAVIKYSPAGEELWTKEIQSNVTTLYSTMGFAVDRYLNVYAGATQNNDIFTQSYSSTGLSLWNASYNGPFNGSDVCTALTTDRFDNVITAGTSVDVGGRKDLVLIKYSQECVGVNQVSAETPIVFSLHQNYPNPFNPSTKIKFEIPLNVETTRRVVSLRIYDILGKEVSVLLNESLKPGVYETDFNGAGLPSGVYFYKLTSGDFSETKKLILLK